MAAALRTAAALATRAFVAFALLAGLSLLPASARAADPAASGAPTNPPTPSTSSATTPASSFDLSALMTRLSSVRSGEATFVEQRFVRTLDAPLVSSGTLGFAAPDRFNRQTLKPRPESMSVEGNVVTVSRSGRSRTFTLDAAPELVGVVEAVRGTLTGNESLVRRYFKAEVSGSASGWTLTLTPLESRLGAQVRQIVMAGERANVARIDMQLTDGDYSTMTITPNPGPTSPGGPAPTSPASAPGR